MERKLSTQRECLFYTYLAIVRADADDSEFEYFYYQIIANFEIRTKFGFFLEKCWVF